jgi:hypothetical protein
LLSNTRTDAGKFWSGALHSANIVIPACAALDAAASDANSDAAMT